MIDGARVFDVRSVGEPVGPWRFDRDWSGEVRAFAGPAGQFFSDGACLYSASADGLSRWDVQSGARTAHIDGFRPSRHHMGAQELAQLENGVIVHWRTKP